MSTTVPARPTVLDATVLSNVAYLNEVPKLQILSRPVAVPAVRAEIKAGIDAYPFLANVATALSDTIPVVNADAEASVLRDELVDRLDHGEAESLAVAELHDGLLVTDDGTARTMARDRGVRLTGTIGVLIELVDVGEIDLATADAWLKRLVDETDYRAPSRELSDYL